MDKGWMVNRLLPALQRRANWKVVGILASLFLVFNFFILPLIASPGGEKFPVLDLKFWYSPDQAYAAIAQYSPEARSFAILTHLTVDVVYPIIYGMLLSLLLVMVLRESGRNQLQQLPLLPWRAVIADYLENLGLVAMFLLYPSRFDLLSWMTTIFTALKWIQIGLSFLGILAGCLLLVLDRLKRRV